MVTRILLVVVAATALVACETSTDPHPQGSYVPWVALARGNVYPLRASPSPPVPIPPATAPCQAAQLEGLLLGRFGAPDNPNTPVALRNNGSTQCYLNGVPDLTILDAQGTVLAAVAGQDGVGTQFDPYIAAVDVLMGVGTPALGPVDSYDAPSMAAGQAVMNIRWTGCAQQPAAQLRVDLPGGGGSVVVAFPVAAPDLNTCAHEAPLVRDPLKPTGVAWPPAPDYIKLQYSIDSPKTVQHGATLVFFVTIHDLDSRDYSLTPCPDYTEALVPNGNVVNYRLNCAPVGVLKAGRSVTFEMKFDVPATTPSEVTNLLWGLVDGRVSPPSFQTPIEII